MQSNRINLQRSQRAQLGLPKRSTLMQAAAPTVAQKVSIYSAQLLMGWDHPCAISIFLRDVTFGVPLLIRAGNRP